jgi:hypothetical protein
VSTGFIYRLGRATAKLNTAQAAAPAALHAKPATCMYRTVRHSTRTTACGPTCMNVARARRVVRRFGFSQLKRRANAPTAEQTIAGRALPSVNSPQKRGKLMNTHKLKWTPQVNGLYHSDKLTLEDRSTTLPCPAWAADLEKLRRVVAGKLCQKAVAGTHIPTDLNTLHELEQRAAAISCRSGGASWQSTVVAARHGGPLALLTALAWRRFRLGQVSTQIAAELGISPCVVRRQTAGLAEVARRLYPDPSLHLPRKHNSKTTYQPFRGGIVGKKEALTRPCNSGDTFNGEPTHAGV